MTACQKTQLCSKLRTARDQKLGRELVARSRCSSSIRIRQRVAEVLLLADPAAAGGYIISTVHADSKADPAQEET